jgi:hypothetical protein
MKLNRMDIHPDEGTMHFAINGAGSVGLIIFYEGTWHVVNRHGNEPMMGNLDDFMWIEW